MTSQLIRRFVVFLWPAILLAAGCDATALKRPIGERLTPDEMKKLTGVWTNPEDEQLHAELNRDGELIVGALEFKEGKFVAANLTVLVRRVAGQTLAYVEGKEDYQGNYFVLRIVHNVDGTVSVGGCDGELMKAAVLRGELPGEILPMDDPIQRAVVDLDEETFAKFIAAHGEDKVFPESHRQVWRRVGKH